MSKEKKIVSFFIMLKILEIVAILILLFGPFYLGKVLYPTTSMCETSPSGCGIKLTNFGDYISVYLLGLMVLFLMVLSFLLFISLTLEIKRLLLYPMIKLPIKIINKNWEWAKRLAK